MVHFTCQTATAGCMMLYLCFYCYLWVYESSIAFHKWMNTWKREDWGCWCCGFCGEALPTDLVSTFVWKCISDFSIIFQHQVFIPCYHVWCRDSGSSGFLISPSVLHLFEALPEGQNQIHQDGKSHCRSVSPSPTSLFLFTKKASFFLCAARGLWDYQGTCVLWGKFPCSL